MGSDSANPTQMIGINSKKGKKSLSSLNILNVFAKLHHTVVSLGSGERSSGHPESYPYHPYCAHC